MIQLIHPVLLDLEREVTIHFGDEKAMILNRAFPGHAKTFVPLSLQRSEPLDLIVRADGEDAQRWSFQVDARTSGVDTDGTNIRRTLEKVRSFLPHVRPVYREHLAELDLEPGVIDGLLEVTHDLELATELIGDVLQVFDEMSPEHRSELGEFAFANESRSRAQLDELTLLRTALN